MIDDMVDLTNKLLCVELELIKSFYVSLWV